MADKIKVYKIFIDGIDKSGKDLIAAYVDQLSGHKYVVKSRGVLSQIAYSYLYHRTFEYDLSSEANTLHVLLKVDFDDWRVRCKMTNEPEIDFAKNVAAFDYAFDLTADKLHIECFNTSVKTPYRIAEAIIAIAESLDWRQQNDKTD